MTVRLLLSAGRGPRECAWALAHLVHRLEADARRHGLTTRRVDAVAGDAPGTYRSVIVELLPGPGVARKESGAAEVEQFAASWTGTLCWQAASPYRSTGRKNWYVTAQPCPQGGARTVFTEADVEVVACRTGGPGGQHRNKASTAARATHRPTGTVVVVDSERQFSLNRRRAIDLLRRRIERGDEVAERAVVTARWRVHDQLVRGDPTRIERAGRTETAAGARSGPAEARARRTPGSRVRQTRG